MALVSARMLRPPQDVTSALHGLRDGDSASWARLFDAVYRELRRTAAGLLHAERGAHTLQPTALVHETYLRLIHEPPRWQDRQHFFVAAATVMRRVLVDSARRRRTRKRGGDWEQVEIDPALLEDASPALDLITLDEALCALRELSPRQALVVELRFFAGLTEAEIAETLHLTVRTVYSDWRMARAWLHRAMKDRGESS